jgi:hypothetical protein
MPAGVEPASCAGSDSDVVAAEGVAVAATRTATEAESGAQNHAGRGFATELLDRLLARPDDPVCPA